MEAVAIEVFVRHFGGLRSCFKNVKEGRSFEVTVLDDTYLTGLPKFVTVSSGLHG